MGLALVGVAARLPSSGRLPNQFPEPISVDLLAMSPRSMGSGEALLASCNNSEQ